MGMNDKVKVQEIIDTLNMEAPHFKILDSEYPVSQQRKDLADRIKEHGIELPTSQEPVAWRYEVDATFDGDKWNKNYAVTESKRLANFCKLSEPTPLYTAPQALYRAMSEYASENCDWNDTDYLLKCAERYGQVAEPSHLHCLVVALVNKLKSESYLTL